MSGYACYSALFFVCQFSTSHAECNGGILFVVGCGKMAGRNATI